MHVHVVHPSQPPNYVVRYHKVAELRGRANHVVDEPRRRRTTWFGNSRRPVPRRSLGCVVSLFLSSFAAFWQNWPRILKGQLGGLAMRRRLGETRALQVPPNYRGSVVQYLWVRLLWYDNYKIVRPTTYYLWYGTKWCVVLY